MVCYSMTFKEKSMTATKKMQKSDIQPLTFLKIVVYYK